MQKFPITPDGYTKLEQELKHLKSIERPGVIKEIAEAREFGDLSENAEYHAAREKQGFIESRIADLENKLSRANVIDPKTLSTDRVKFGCTVELFDEDTEKEYKYTIVSEYEANVEQNKISIMSPLAHAMVNKPVGEVVEVPTPKGIKTYEILKISIE